MYIEQTYRHELRNNSFNMWSLPLRYSLLVQCKDLYMHFRTICFHIHIHHKSVESWLRVDIEIELYVPLQVDAIVEYKGRPHDLAVSIWDTLPNQLRHNPLCLGLLICANSHIHIFIVVLSTKRTYYISQGNNCILTLDHKNKNNIFTFMIHAYYQ